MFKLIAGIVERMGNWFGIIFKIVLPFIVMYRPIKTLSFSIVVFGAYYGGNADFLNTIALALFGLLYVILVALLICAPKVASAVEFLLIAYYFAFLGFVYFAGFYSSFFEGMNHYLLIYIRELPLVLIFLTGKIIFFFFIRSNRASLEQMKKQDAIFFSSSDDDYIL